VDAPGGDGFSHGVVIEVAAGMDQSAKSSGIADDKDYTRGPDRVGCFVRLIPAETYLEVLPTEVGQPAKRYSNKAEVDSSPAHACVIEVTHAQSFLDVPF